MSCPLTHHQTGIMAELPFLTEFTASCSVKDTAAAGVTLWVRSRSTYSCVALRPASVAKAGWPRSSNTSAPRPQRKLYQTIRFWPLFLP